MKKKNRMIVFCTVLSMFVLLACGLLDTAREIADFAGEVKDFQENVEVGQPVDDKGGSTDKNKPQEVSGKDLDNFPLYPGSVRTFYLSLTEGDSKATQLIYEIPKLPEETLNYYQEDLEKHGWEITTTMHWGGDSYYLVAGGDEGKEIILTIGESNFPDYTNLVVQANH